MLKLALAVRERLDGLKAVDEMTGIGVGGAAGGCRCAGEVERSGTTVEDKELDGPREALGELLEHAETSLTAEAVADDAGREEAQVGKQEENFGCSNADSVARRGGSAG
jgi:hypothetical protein